MNLSVYVPMNYRVALNYVLREATIKWFYQDYETNPEIPYPNVLGFWSIIGVRELDHPYIDYPNLN